MAANRKAHSLRESIPFEGQCYLGLNDLVMPFRFRGKTLGVFYCGSIIREETRELSEDRLDAVLQELGTPQEKLRRPLRDIPVLGEQDWQRLREDLQLLHDMAQALLEARDLPIEHYKPHRISALARQDHERPPLVRRALHEMRVNFAELRGIRHLAEILHCSPDHLSRQFKSSLKTTITEYLHEVRVEHAKHRLRNPHRTVEEIAYSVGYLDKSHFLKHFKGLAGSTPGQYRSRFVEK
jgi:AraC-like DNA-binding protein